MEITKNLTNIYLPKNEIYADNLYEITFYSDLTNEGIEFEVEDMGNLSNFYVFNIDFSDFKAGEYKYKIWKYCFDKRHEIANGLIIIKDVNSTIDDIEEYDNFEKYIVYEG